MPRTFRFALIAAITAAALSCGDGSTDPARSLTVSRTEIVFDDAHMTSTITLQGVTGAWRIVAAPSWVLVTPSHGSRDTTVLTLEAPALTSLTPGQYSGDVVIAAGEREAAVHVRAAVLAHPFPAVESTAIDFGAALDTLQLLIANAGNAPMAWRLGTDASWLAASPATGQLARDARTTVRLVVDRRALTIGSHLATLSLGVDGLTAVTRIEVRATVPDTPLATYDVKRLVFAMGVESATFTLKNAGRATLSWSISHAPAWMRLDTTTGSLGPGQATMLTAIVDRTSAPARTTSDSLVLATNGGDAALPLVLANDGRAAGALWHLDAPVADAAYDRRGDRIVIVAAQSAELLIADMRLGIVDRVVLPEIGRFVTLSPDGRRAAITHDAYATVVDLETRRVIGRYGVGRVMRVALSDAGWLYGFPLPQWDQIRSINIWTGEQTKAAWLTYGSIGKVHPGSSYVFAVNGWSLERWDVRQGPARFLGELTGYANGGEGDFWFDETGSRIITAARSVFNVLPGAGIEFAGQLPGSLVVGAFDHSSSANRYYMVTMPYLAIYNSTWPYRGDATEISVVDAGSFTVVGTLSIPTFDVTVAGWTTHHPASGRFVFASASGARVYAVVQAPASAGLVDDWAIATFDVGGAP